MEGDSFTLNHRTRRDWDNCEVVLNPPSAYQELTGTHLLYLRPDEFGVADYRPTFWGFAHEAVNETFVTHGLPTLRDIRQAAAGQPIGAAGPTGNGAAWSPGVLAAALLGMAALAWAALGSRGP